MGICGGAISDLMSQLEFYLSHSPKLACFSTDEFGKMIAKIKGGSFLNTVGSEFLKNLLNLNPARLLRIKDETYTTDDAIKIWISSLPGLTCTFPELKEHEKGVNEMNFHAFGIQETSDGYTVDFFAFDEALQLTYPQSHGKILRGVNIDGTEMGGRNTTAASVRVLNDEVKEKIQKTNSAKETWFFSLYYGNDARDEMEDNVFINSEAKSFGAFLTQNPQGTYFLLDGKTAHEVAGLGGHNSNEDFQLYTSEETSTSK